MSGSKEMSCLEAIRDQRMSYRWNELWLAGQEIDSETEYIKTDIKTHLQEPRTSGHWSSFRIN